MGEGVRSEEVKEVPGRMLLETRTQLFGVGKYIYIYIYIEYKYTYWGKIIHP
jgi:hypothetical protein